MKKQISSEESKGIVLMVPNIKFRSSNSISVNGRTFEIDPTSRQARILEFYAGFPTGLLRRNELIERLYEDELEEGLVTIRFRDSQWRSGHQVMSRLRRTLHAKFEQHMPQGTEWLAYCEKLDGWILYKLPGYGSDGGWHS